MCIRDSGGLLSFGPIVWLWSASSRRTAALIAERSAILAAAEQHQEPPLPRDRWTTWADIMTTRQDIELAIIDNATTAARWPLSLVAVGIVASTLGGVLSLYV